MDDTRYISLEKKIDGAECDGLRARWECGQELLKERKKNGGFQLPQGRMEELTTLLEKSDRELSYRMKFAEKFPLEENYCNALQKFPSWHAVVESLTKKKKAGMGNELTDDSRSDSWLTPPEIVTRLGCFDLDPCGCVGMPWKLATRVYTPPTDGLLEPWEGRVFCNPPYSKKASTEFINKMIEHGDGILLYPARLETNLWNKIWGSGDAFLFTAGQIKFYNPDGSRNEAGASMHPTVLVAFGQSNVQALRDSGLAGGVVLGPIEYQKGKKASHCGMEKSS
jgi:hypothetical protein